MIPLRSVRMPGFASRISEGDVDTFYLNGKKYQLVNRRTIYYAQ